MIDFPNAPLNGQIFTSGGSTWTYDGSKWVASGTIPLTPQATGDNRIINGDMRIDQRNNGVGGTANGVYTVDRWKYSSNQAAKASWNRGAPGPVGYPYCLRFLSSSAYAALAGDFFAYTQPIEGDMVADFAWGAAGAQPATLSFWAYSSIGGTFSGSVQNGGQTRSYPFTYPLPATAWTFIVVSIPADVTGTWTLKDNGVGIYLNFDHGSGANFRGPAGAWASGNYLGATGSVATVAVNGATFFVTGVKLEVGSVATPYNRQTMAKSLADCQRYYQALNNQLYAYSTTGSLILASWTMPVQMRAAPTVTFSNLTGVTNLTGLGTNNTTAATYNAFGTITATGSGIINFNTALSAEL